MNTRKTSQDYHDLATSRGFKWLGPEAMHTHEKTVWRCNQGHEWAATYGKILQGRGCPFCSGNISKTPQDYRDLAAKRGFQWNGPEVKSNHQGTRWKCDQGHEWDATYHTISRGRGCPECRNKKFSDDRRFPPEKYREKAASKNIRWIGEYPQRSHMSTLWECVSGHQWATSYSSLKGCPYCAGTISKVPSEYHELAHEKQVTWLGPEVQINSEKTWWRCSFKHEFKMSYSQLNKAGCPFCSGRASKTAGDYAEIAKKFNFIWLGPLVENTTTKTNWQCPEGHVFQAKYNNISSGRGCSFCRWKKGGAAHRVKPELYRKLAKKNGLTWIEESGLKAKTPTVWVCKKCGYNWNVSYDTLKSHQRKIGCPKCRNTAHKREQDYIDLATANKLQFVGPKPGSVLHKTSWCCQNGHVFDMDYHHIERGQGCPKCIQFVNGAATSKPQRDVWAMIGGELNVLVGKYAADIGLDLDGILICIEYDCHYWHRVFKDTTDQERERDSFFISQGWRVLRIKANELLPTLDQLNAAIAELLNGATYTEIVLPDWGGE